MPNHTVDTVLDLIASLTHIDYLMGVVTCIVCLKAYLVTNKIWIRRYNEDVIKSVSCTSLLIGLVPLTVFLIDNVMKKQLLMTVLLGSVIMSTSIVILIGTGLWSKVRKKGHVFLLLKDALLHEKNEIGRLAKVMLADNQEKTVLQILNHVAHIDDDLNKEEVMLIEEFKAYWNLDKGIETHMDHDNRFEEIIRLFKQYVQSAPSPTQVYQLIDMIKMVIDADLTVHESEEAILNEMELLANRLLYKKDIPLYELIKVTPKNELSDDITGGVFDVVARYHTLEYAQKVRDRYKEEGRHYDIALVEAPSN